MSVLKSSIICGFPPIPLIQLHHFVQHRSYSTTPTKQYLDLTNKRFATKAIHAGCFPDPSTGAIVTPISLATTYKQKSPGVHQGYEYSRTGNPTRQSFEDCVAALESGKWGLAFASGMAATTSIIHLLEYNDELISIDDTYGGTYRYFSKIAGPHGLQIKYVDLTIPGSLQSALTPKTKMLWLETPTNPNLKIVDIQELVKITKKKAIPTPSLLSTTHFYPLIFRDPWSWERIL